MKKFTTKKKKNQLNPPQKNPRILLSNKILRISEGRKSFEKKTVPNQYLTKEKRKKKPNHNNSFLYQFCED